MVTTTGLDARTPRLSLAEKLWSLNWGLLLLLTTIASFGFAMLYSAANGDLQAMGKRDRGSGPEWQQAIESCLGGQR